MGWGAARATQLQKIALLKTARIAYIFLQKRNTKDQVSMKTCSVMECLTLHCKTQTKPEGNTAQHRMASI